jgi:excisionase family DNA binding protein
MSYTLGEAAKAVGLSKPTLSRAIKNGKLSGKKLEDGSYQINPSELERWRDANGHRNAASVSNETPVIPASDSHLQLEVEALRRELDMVASERDRERSQLTDQIDDYRARLSKADEERARLTAVLTDQRNTDSETTKRGFWARLLG